MSPDSIADVCSASPWLTTKEAAAYLKRGRVFIMNEVRAGRLRAARVGGRREILTRREWLDEFVTDQAARIVQPVRRRA